jgi:hypothetical protein
MVLIRRLAATFLVFCSAVIVADVILLLFGASVGWLVGVGLLLVAPTVYHVIKLVDDVRTGRRLRHRTDDDDEPRLPHPIH